MTKMNGPQKAAVLMVSLGDDVAASIFKYLEEDEIQAISREIALTKHVGPEQADEVLEEFHTMTLAKSYIAQGGIEYAKKLLIKSVGPEAARKIIDRLTKALESSAGFSSIERANPQQLSKFIQSEHPQTIALILAHLNASQAGDLIASLPEALRADVAMRMANLQEISPEVVRRISLILEQKLEALGSFATEAYGGVRAVAELFNRMDRNTGRTVLEKIETENPQLAASIRDLMFVFDDILLIPAESGVLPKETDVRTQVTSKISLNIPLLSAAMAWTTVEASCLLCPVSASHLPAWLSQRAMFSAATPSSPPALVNRPPT